MLRSLRFPSENGSHALTDLIQLIYSSKPFGFDEATLSEILLTARRNNERDGITGALICRRDLYLQLLEGPQAAVEARYQQHCPRPPSP